MTHQSLTAACAVLILLAGSSWAGGSFSPVAVESLVFHSATEYELVVRPIETDLDALPRDPYFGKCPLFTVRGAYSIVHSTLRFPAFVTRESHTAALAKLSGALKTRTPVNFGWIGTGFVPIDPKKPCVVRSRALHLRVDSGTTSVLSLHNAA
jgi:hypothetical protein